MTTNSARKIDQKEYLKKYLSGDKVKKKKKDKKHKKSSLSSAKVKIIDDDANHLDNGPQIDEELLLTGDDAPQIVGEYIEENPAEGKLPKWRTIGIKEEPASFKCDEDDLWGGKSGDKINSMKTHDFSPSRRKGKKRRDSSLSPSRRTTNSPGYSNKIKREPITPDKSPPRRRQDADITSPRNKKSHREYINRSSPDQTPPRRRQNFDHSPPRRDKNRSTVQSDSRRIRENSTDQSPPRRSKYRSSEQSPSRKRKNSNPSPPRKNIKHSSDQSSRRKNSSERSPHGRGRHHTPDQSPQRKSRNFTPEQSTIRRRRSSDLSPPRKGRDLSPDQSPPRRRRKSIDQSPPRKARNHSPDQSPARRRRKSIDQSPPRRIQNSSPRRKKYDSPPRSSGADSENNIKREKLSPPQPRRSRWERQELEKSLSPPPTHKPKPGKTLEGKKAGLQDAHDLLKESIERRKQEDLLFEKMSSEISGRHAEVQVRSTGRKGRRAREAGEEDPEERKRKEEHEEKKKQLYDRWGKGLKQIEDHKNRLIEQAHESSKPLARYEDDEDLERHLKEQERAEDPMLEYMRQKRKEKEKQSGKPQIPRYEGPFPENRFGIRPGYRWDGVDRSNGYEKKYFAVQNEKRAHQDEAYKYSVEDM